MTIETVEALLQAGIDHFQAKDYLEAFLKCDRALELQSENALILGWRGRALTQMSYGHLDDRRAQLPEKYRDTWISSSEATTWWTACHAETRSCLERALSLAPENPELWQFMSEFWLQQGYYHNRDDAQRQQDYTEALKAIEQAISLEPNNPTFWRSKIEVCGRLYNHILGLKSAEKLLELTPDDAEVWNTRAQLLRYLERYDAALISSDRALALASEAMATQQRRAYWGRGEALEAMGQLETALASYEQALTYPGIIGAQQSRVATLRHRLALQQLEQAITNNPQDVDAWSAKAQRHLEQEEYPAALLCYDRVLELQPNALDTLKSRSLAHLRLGNTEAALADIEQALSLDSEDLGLWYQKGKILTDTEQYEAAIACYDHILETDPNHLDALYGRVQALLFVSLSDAALAEEMSRAFVYIERLISLVPQLSEAGDEATSMVWYVRSLILINLERYEEAFLSQQRANRWYRESLDDPEGDRASLATLQIFEGWYNWGHYLSCNGYGNYREALTILRQALSYNPNHPQTLSFCAYACLKLKRYEQCIAYYEQALALQPEDATDWHNLALAQKALGQLESALQSYDRALAVKPDDFQTLTNRAVLLKDLGRYTEALSDCDRALAIKPNYETALYAKAIIFVQQDDPEEALANLQEYVRLVTTHKAYHLVYNYAQTLLAEPAFAPLHAYPAFQALFQYNEAN